MLYGLLVSLFVINCLFLILIILIQQGKGNMGLGNIGGATQMIFGGSGGADIFQKITWVLATSFMILSLTLAVMRSGTTGVDYSAQRSFAEQQQASTVPVMPMEEEF